MLPRWLGMARSTVWRTGRRSVIAGMALIALVVLAALSDSRLVPRSAYSSSVDVLRAPSSDHPLGTDDLGRGVWAGVVRGARVSLLIGVVAAALASALGLLVGGTAGLSGGVPDELLMRIAEVFQALPRLFLIIVVVTLFGSELWLVAALVGFSYWPSSARLVRAQVLVMRHTDFVAAARALGCRPYRVLTRHILPAALAPLAVNAALQAGGAVLVEAGRSFLGVGDSSMVSWGGMLSEAHHFMRDAWWVGVFPGLAITMTVLGWSLLADGIAASRR